MSQSPAVWKLLLAIGGVIALLAVIAWSASLSDHGDALIRNTVRLSLAWYAVALALMMRLRGSDWVAASSPGRIARSCWTWSAVCFLVHLGMAFHYYHDWSHEHAFNHTREVSGVGEGVFASYLFTWLWLGDVIWWWAQPEMYAARSPWVDRLLHTFMLFVIFNGMVVFESGLIRWAGVVMFTALPGAWLILRRLPGRQTA